MSMGTFWLDTEDGVLLWQEANYLFCTIFTMCCIVLKLYKSVKEKKDQHVTKD